MSKKNKIVKFHSGHGRIYIVEDLSTVKRDDKTIINPDLSHLKGIPPEFWTLVDGNIVALTGSARNSHKELLHSQIEIVKQIQVDNPKFIRHTKIACALLALGLLINACILAHHLLGG